MAANPMKQNIRYAKADASWRKKSYNGLTEDEKKMVKLTEKYNQLEKDMDYFWATAPRNARDGVDWEKCTEEQLDYFEYINKCQERTMKSINRLEEKGIIQDETMKLFRQLNTKSLSF